MSETNINLGPVSAYALAKTKGYTGTEAEFAQLMANYATVGQQAAQSAAIASTAANTANTKASEAATSANNAATSATNASRSATAASQSATAASNSASSAATSAQTANAKSTEATNSANAASQSAGSASQYSQQALTARTAAQAAQTAAESAKTAAEAAAAESRADYTTLNTKVDNTKTALEAEIDAVADDVADLDTAVQSKASTTALQAETARATAEEARIEALFTAPTEEAVADWLEAHPEATTTVQDGAISYAKLDSTLKAKADDVDDLKSSIGQMKGFNAQTKAALLACFRGVGWLVDNSEELYAALEDALYPPADLDHINATYSGSAVMAGTNIETLRSNLTVLAVFDNGTSQEVTTYALSGSLTNNPSVITVTYGGKSTTISVPVIVLSSISAVYTQSGTVYDTDALNVLKADLVVTAHYSDSSTAVVTDYTLSGTLTQGTSSISVSYGGKSTSFSVTVTHATMARVTANMELGVVITAETGVASANSKWFASDYIEIDPSWILLSTYYSATPNGWTSCAFYDLNKTYVSGGSKNAATPIFIPSGVAYVRISIETTGQTETAQFEFYTNLSEELNWSDTANGAVNNSTGAITTSGKDAYIAYDVPVASDDRKFVWGKLSTTTYNWVQGAFYDSSGTFISGFNNQYGVDSYADVPSNAAKFAIQAYPNNNASNNDPAHQIKIALVK